MQTGLWFIPAPTSNACSRSFGICVLGSAAWWRGIRSHSARKRGFCSKRKLHFSSSSVTSHTAQGSGREGLQPWVGVRAVQPLNPRWILSFLQLWWVLTAVQPFAPRWILSFLQPWWVLQLCSPGWVLELCSPLPQTRFYHFFSSGGC